MQRFLAEKPARGITTVHHAEYCRLAHEYVEYLGRSSDTDPAANRR
jgi:hypothetical protein